MGRRTKKAIREIIKSIPKRTVQSIDLNFPHSNLEEYLIDRYEDFALIKSLKTAKYIIGREIKKYEFLPENENLREDLEKCLLEIEKKSFAFYIVSMDGIIINTAYYIKELFK